MSEPITRRELFNRIRKGLLVTTGVVAAGEAADMIAHSNQTPPTTVVTVGQPTEYAVPSLTFIRDARAYLGRDGLGFYVIDAQCTHLGCVARFEGSEFVCPCHNSHYAADGTLKSGPAEQNLRYLDVELNTDNHLVIRRDRNAHPSDRLIV
jgi:Rieske Fe-S protein